MNPDLSCQDLLRFVALYVAGRLAESERQAFESHLAHCPKCVAFINSLPAVMALAEGCRTQPSAMPAHVPSELIAAVAESRQAA